MDPMGCDVENFFPSNFNGSAAATVSKKFLPVFGLQSGAHIFWSSSSSLSVTSISIAVYNIKNYIYA